MVVPKGEFTRGRSRLLVAGLCSGSKMQPRFAELPDHLGNCSVGLVGCFCRQFSKVNNQLVGRLHLVYVLMQRLAGQRLLVTVWMLSSETSWLHGGWKQSGGKSAA
ncbi:hypothetical protein E2C01_054402 [Portunus trituberculatus]|uniref:Uncharacterized protein n=1 Tax=Portunus trituberculatus TaxID=210409 RepID=A0A5B7GRY2_PORTR|nr:hypothetical protein [Portunus trituberculatus]